MTIPQLQALFEIALDHFRRNDLRNARENCEKILAQSPREALAVLLLGQCYAREGRFQSSEEHVRHALALDPSLSQIPQALAELANARNTVQAHPYFREYMLNRPRYRDYPRSVAIETIGRCNAACNFCPHPGLERNTLTMSDNLFDKIIGDLRKIPEHHPLNIFPNLVNEPFMDRKIFDRLSTINSRLPRATLFLFTNLSVMRRDFFEHIATIRIS
jgi:tetratricopeptide (TPR) repeat protein